MKDNQIIFIKEEKWTRKEDLGISNNFLDVIKKNTIKIIEEKGSVIKFVFVGMITFKDELLVILPKYFDEKFYSERECILQLVQVFRKIPKSILKENRNEIFLHNNEGNYSEISICDYLIKDYIENDYYVKNIVSTNLNSGNGLLDWKKTINELDPIISNGFPIYNNCYYTQRNSSGNYFITEIHKAVIEYSLAKYSQVLGYNMGNFNYEKAKRKLSSLGNTEQITYTINNELELSFNDRNINLFRALSNFFKKRQSDNSKKLDLYGTTNFELIWEHLLGDLFKNEYSILSKKISPILWKSVNGTELKNNLNSLKPDILKEFEDKIIILDAKYYSIKLRDTSISGNPGSYDIVKQLTYALAFSDNGYTKDRILNLLLFPKEGKELFSFFGYVNLDFFKQNPIVNVYVSPKLLIERYLSRKRLSNKELNDFVNKDIEFIKNY